MATTEQTVVFFNSTRRLAKALARRAAEQGVTRAEYLRQISEKATNHQGTVKRRKPRTSSTRRKPLARTGRGRTRRTAMISKRGGARIRRGR